MPNLFDALSRLRRPFTRETAEPQAPEDRVCDRLSALQLQANGQAQRTKLFRS
jgi:hypothetical protein